MKEEARKLFNESLEAGYSPAEAKKRVAKFMTTGEIEADPTEGVWKGLIQQESGGRQSAVSPKGARGIAQVMPKTAPEAAALAGVDWDPNAYERDSGYNGQIGRAYLRKQFADFGSPELALAAYNAGPGAVRKAGGDISRLPAETQNYVPAILGRSEPQDMALQPELDSPEDIAAAKEALAQPRDKAKQAFMAALEKGGSLDDAKAAARAVLAPPQAAPAPQELNNEGDPVGGDDPMRVKINDPVARQEELMSGGMLDRFTGGLERSIGGLDRGARKLLGQLLGNEEMVKKSEGQEQGVRDVVEKYDPTGSGISAADLGRLTGDAASFAMPGAAIGRATAGAGTILGPALGGAITGGLQGLLQPTTEDQSQGMNAAMGAGIGGVLGGLGGGITRAVGTPDPSRQSAVEALRQTGVEVPEGFAYDSPISNVLRRAGGQRGSGSALDQNITQALARRLGLPEGTGITNEALEQNKNQIGRRIGEMNKGFTAAPDDQFVVDISNASKDYRLAGNMVSGNQRSKIDELRRFAREGRPMTGREYQSKRTALTEDSATGGAAEKKLNRALRGALDDLFERQNTVEGLPELRGQYRLSSILRNGSGVPTEGYTAKAIRNRLETAAGKGRVDPETRQLIQSAADLAPGSAIGGEAVGGASATEAAISRLGQPTLLGTLGAGLRGVAGPASNVYDSGMLQGLTNNQTTRLALINLLRGGTIPITSQLYTSGEE